jgi:hypothetical protein
MDFAVQCERVDFQRESPKAALSIALSIALLLEISSE